MILPMGHIANDNYYPELLIFVSQIQYYLKNYTFLLNY